MRLMGEENNSLAGHRRRLRSRFARSGAAGLQDYEIIELLLTYAIPRRDVKPLARMLLDKFQNLAGVLHASGSELLSVPGIGSRTAMLIILMREIMLKAMEQDIREKPVINTRQDIFKFLRLKLGSEKKETLMVFYLDSGRHIMEYDIWRGTVDRTVIYTREIIEKALICRACGVILAHNHPGGSKGLSQEDLKLTENMKDTLSRLGIELLDHIVVARSSVTGYMESDLQTEENYR